MIKVGDTIYQFDDGYRVYDKQFPGHGPIYSEHFRPRVITGETPKFWLAGKHKVNKVTMLETVRDWGEQRWYTQQGRDDAIFREAHGYKLSEKVRRTATADQLRQIAAIMGCEL